MSVKMVKKHYKVTDEMIDSGRVQNVIEPLWWSVSIYDGESEMNSSLEPFSEQQKYV